MSTKPTIMKIKTTRKRQKKKIKSKRNLYCFICDVHFSSIGKRNNHMNNRHSKSDLEKFGTEPIGFTLDNENGVKFPCTSSNTLNKPTNNQFKCNVCNWVTSDLNTFQKHEKTHDQVNNLNTVSHQSLTNDNVTNPSPPSVPNTEKDSEKTQKSSDKRYKKQVTSFKCFICKLNFDSLANYKKHLPECKIFECSQKPSVKPNPRVPKQIKCEDLEGTLRRVPKIGNPNIEHLKALNEFTLLPQKPFNCIVCSKSKCEIPDHYVVHVMVNPFECLVCYERFSEENKLKSHRAEHIADNLKQNTK